MDNEDLMAIAAMSTEELASHLDAITKDGVIKDCVRLAYIIKSGHVYNGSLEHLTAAA